MSRCKEGLFEVGAASSILSVFERRRRQKNHTIPAIMSAPQIPPTTSPAIAPLFVEEAFGELAIFWCISCLILTSKHRTSRVRLIHTGRVGTRSRSPHVARSVSDPGTVRTADSIAYYQDPDLYHADCTSGPEDWISYVTGPHNPCRTVLTFNIFRQTTSIGSPIYRGLMEYGR